MNIVLFVPFGFFLSGLLPEKKTFIVLLGLLFSLLIETLQYTQMRGSFEIDDLINNTLGSYVGAFFYSLIAKHSHRRIVRNGVLCISVIGVIAATVIGFHFTRDTVDSSYRHYCFQVDDVKTSEMGIELSGFAFRYKHQSKRVQVLLKSTKTGEMYPLHTQFGIERSDVNGYFKCEYDYSSTGFEANGKVDPAAEYEIYISLDWPKSVPTGVYLSGARIHYAMESSFESPVVSDEILLDVIENGSLRLYRPDYHCWVYQHDGAVFWIADQGFPFDEDGSTYIQYQLLTTQTDRLPQQRLDKNWLWDNIGGNFEDYEIHGDFGNYRVMKRELPADYSITAIVTGYYTNGEWVWQNYFRPIYEFH